jgi:hypothetical protein
MIRFQQGKYSDCLCCVGPPIHTATTDTHRHDADTSRQLGILSKLVGCRCSVVVVVECEQAHLK